MSDNHKAQKDVFHCWTIRAYLWIEIKSYIHCLAVHAVCAEWHTENVAHRVAYKIK